MLALVTQRAFSQYYIGTAFFKSRVYDCPSDSTRLKYPVYGQGDPWQLRNSWNTVSITNV